MFANGPESVWTALATSFLYHHTPDGRYREVLQASLSAAHAGRRLTVLEVGCNVGYLGGVLLRHGHDYLGIDVEPTFIDEATRSYGKHFSQLSVEELAAAGDPAFDMVCALETIEHVRYPREFLAACVSLLRPGGTLFLSTPDGDAMPTDQWDTDPPPTHLSVLSRRTFRLAIDSSWSLRFSDDPLLLRNRAGVMRFLRRHIPDGMARLSARSNTNLEPPDMDPQSPRFHLRSPVTLPYPFIVDMHWPRPAIRYAAWALSELAGLRSVGRSFRVIASRPPTRT